MAIKILYIGTEVQAITYGADVLNIRNIEYLKKITHNHFNIIGPTKCNKLQQLLTLRHGGYTRKIEKKVLAQLAHNKYTHVFLSQSLLGHMARTIKKHFPNIPIICCFHNIEKKFSRDMLRVSGVRILPFYIRAIYNEKLAVKYSDITLFLNRRDAEEYHTEYKLNPNFVIPISYEDRFQQNRLVQRKVTQQYNILFIGSAFYANTEGIKWYMENVLPYIDGHLTIIGKGMDRYQKEWNNERVTVLGYVRDLDDYYYKADVIVMPIFSGSGMKTKTAEALMYGKTIQGTKEAFEGYEIDPRAMYSCQTAQEFITTYNQLTQENRLLPYNEHARNLFLTKYSEEITYKAFKQIFNLES